MTIKYGPLPTDVISLEQARLGRSLREAEATIEIERDGSRWIVVRDRAGKVLSQVQLRRHG